MPTDTERLDWLEQKQALINFAQDGPHVCAGPYSEEYQHFYGNSYREALDAAMAGFTDSQDAWEAEFNRLSKDKERADLAYNAALLRKVSRG